MLRTYEKTEATLRRGLGGVEAGGAHQPVTPRPRRVDTLWGAHVGPTCGSDGCTSQFGRPGSLDSPFSRPRPGVVDMVRICYRKSRVSSRVAPGTLSDSPLLWYQAVPGRLPLKGGLYPHSL
eukprot:scaffold460_cov391-Pavlova_lutheri.AAC.2